MKLNFTRILTSGFILVLNTAFGTDKGNHRQIKWLPVIIQTAVRKSQVRHSWTEKRVAAGDYSIRRRIRPGEDTESTGSEIGKEDDEAVVIDRKLR